MPPVYDSQIDRSGAGALVPPEVAREIIQLIPEQSGVMQLASRSPNISTNQQRVPVLSTLPVAYFVTGDNGLKQTTSQSWRNVYFNVEELACIVPIPEAVLADSTYDIWGEVRPRIAEAFGAAFDAAVLYGTDAPASWPDSVLEQAIDKDLVVNQGTDLYQDLLGEGGIVDLVEQQGFAINGHIAALRLKGKLRGLVDDNNRPLFIRTMQEAAQWALDGEPIYFPRNGAIDPTKTLDFTGDWTQLRWAIRSDISYLISREATISDADGKVLFNLFQQDMVALRATFRLAWALPNPPSRLAPDDDVRLPFAVLAPTGYSSGDPRGS